MKPHTLGNLLVALQFGSLAALIGLTALQYPAGELPWRFWLPLGLSGLLGFWALTANQPGNFNIRPTPRAGGRLVHGGPYRWIRHPMYSAVLLLGAACALALASPLAALLWALLACTLLFKALLEERWMAALHPDYLPYQARTRRFVPFLF